MLRMSPSQIEAQHLPQPLTENKKSGEMGYAEVIGKRWVGSAYAPREGLWESMESSAAVPCP